MLRRNIAPITMVLIKKYSNRRLYDTRRSRYITQGELSRIIQGGDDVQIVDARSGRDLTQVTLAQVVLEGPGARLLPASLLHQLIRLQDDAFVEFFGRYVAWALDVYGATRGGAGAFASWPFAAADPPRDEVGQLRAELERLKRQIVALQKNG